MTLIQYIGNQPTQTDRLGDSGLVWRGPGAVVEVEDPKVAARLLRHPDVWRLADKSPDILADKSPVEPIDKSLKPVEKKPVRRLDISEFSVRTLGPILDNLEGEALNDLLAQEQAQSTPRVTIVRMINEELAKRG